MKNYFFEFSFENDSVFRYFDQNDCVFEIIMITIKCAIYTTFFIALLMDSFIRDVDNLAFIFIPFQVILRRDFKLILRSRAVIG